MQEKEERIEEEGIAEKMSRDPGTHAPEEGIEATHENQ